MIRGCLAIVIMLGAGIVVAPQAQADARPGALCDLVEELARYAWREKRAAGGAGTDGELLDATTTLIQLDATYWQASPEERRLLQGVAAHVYQAVYNGVPSDPESMKAKCLRRIQGFEEELHKAHPACWRQAAILLDYAEDREAGVSESEARAWSVLAGGDNATLRESAIEYVYRRAGDVPAAEVAQKGYVACLKESIGD